MNSGVIGRTPELSDVPGVPSAVPSGVSFLLMPRSVLARILSTVFALWFAVVIGDPGVLHACPEHGAHASHGSHAAHHAAASQHGGAPAHSGGCTCMGSCCATPVVAPLPGIANFVVSEAIIPAVGQPEYSCAAPAAAAPRLLPFSNGPPQA
jgi:hypothetical protein